MASDTECVKNANAQRLRSLHAARHHRPSARIVRSGTRWRINVVVLWRSGAGTRRSVRGYRSCFVRGDGKRPIFERCSANVTGATTWLLVIVTPVDGEHDARSRKSWNSRTWLIFNERSCLRCTEANGRRTKAREGALDPHSRVCRSSKRMKWATQHPRLG